MLLNHTAFIWVIFFSKYTWIIDTVSELKAGQLMYIESQKRTKTSKKMKINIVTKIFIEGNRKSRHFTLLHLFL